MRVLAKFIFPMLLSFLFQSCSSPKPQKEYFVGTWKADDGATVELYENGKCKVSGLNYYKIYPFEKHKNQQLNFDGTWDLTNDGEPKLHLSYNEGKTYQYKGETKEYKAGFDFEVSGQGAFGNKPPWGLYVILGDPDDIDESNKYKFVKQ